MGGLVGSAIRAPCEVPLESQVTVLDLQNHQVARTHPGILISDVRSSKPTTAA